MRRFEKVLSMTVSITFFSLAAFAFEERRADSSNEERSEFTYQYHYLNEDQDLLMIPSLFDLLEKVQTLQDGSEFKHKQDRDNELTEYDARINIFQSLGSPGKDGWTVDDTLLFFDTGDTHLEKDTPKRAETGYLNTILMASLLDELH